MEKKKFSIFKEGAVERFKARNAEHAKIMKLGLDEAAKQTGIPENKKDAFALGYLSGYLASNKQAITSSKGE